MTKFIITFYDGHEIQVNEKQGAAIKAAKARGIKTISLGESIYEVASISRIEYLCTDGTRMQLGAGGELLEKKSPMVSNEIRKRVDAELREKFGWPQRERSRT